MTTFLILALVFAGALSLARILILIGAGVYGWTRLASFRRGRVFVPSIDAVIDWLIRREWIRQPRRRPSTA